MTTIFTLKPSNKKIYRETISELSNGIISCQNKLPKKILFYILINVPRQDILDNEEITFFPVLLRYNCHKGLFKFKVHTMMI